MHQTRIKGKAREEIAMIPYSAEARKPQRSHYWPWLAVGALLAGLATAVWLALWV